MLRADNPATNRCATTLKTRLLPSREPPPHRLTGRSALHPTCHCEERKQRINPPATPCHCEERSDESIRRHTVSLRGAQRRSNPLYTAVSRRGWLHLLAQSRHDTTSLADEEPCRAENPCLIGSPGGSPSTPRVIARSESDEAIPPATPCHCEERKRRSNPPATPCHCEERKRRINPPPHRVIARSESDEAISLTYRQSAWDCLACRLWCEGV